MVDAQARFEVKVDRSGECWEWLGGKDQEGYGVFWIETQTGGAHRFAYEQANGPVPPGLVIDHLCRNPGCVNPDHMEVVTNQVNTLRGVGPTAQNARKTDCNRGHPLSGSNLYVNPSGERQCRVCRNARQRSYMKRKRDALSVQSESQEAAE